MAIEQQVKGTGNVVLAGLSGSIDISMYIGKSAEYDTLLADLETLQRWLSCICETDLTQRLEVSQKIEAKKQSIEAFERDVLTLAEMFARVEIDTDRLAKVKDLFDRREFAEVRATLEADQPRMADEQNRLLNNHSTITTQLKNNATHLKNNAAEYLILAQTRALDYGNPARFDNTCAAYELSIKSWAWEENLFSYAQFLQKHNHFADAERFYRLIHGTGVVLEPPQSTALLNNLAILHSDTGRLKEAEKEYEEALKIYRSLAGTNPEAYLPYVATTLNNLANLHKGTGRLKEAEKEYEEALKIRRSLAGTNPEAYLPYVATTLNNLATLHSDTGRLKEAEKEYEEALKIRRSLAGTNPEAYLPDVATTLNNLATLHSDTGRLKEAEKEYEEALKMYRSLAGTNPEAYLPYVATTLNNLAILHKGTGRLKEAEKEYEEALKIRRSLAGTNPEAYLPYVATTLNNLAVFYTDAVSDREKAERNASEAVNILASCGQLSRFQESTLNSARRILQHWEASHGDPSITSRR